MTNGSPKKHDADAPPPSYAAVVSGQPTTSAPVSSQVYGPTPINQAYHPQGSTQAPLLDPRSQTAREQARHRALMRFFEAFLWALIIQMIAAAIIGGSIWPEFSRHWVNTHVRE